VTSSSVVIDTSTSSGRSALTAWSAAVVLGLALLGAGLAGTIPLSLLLPTAVFLFFAVANDVRSHRLPNLLTLPALLAALLLSPWLGGTSGPLEATVGALLGLALLVGPYAIGGVGAGDVKAVMALGAWIGPAAMLGAVAWALIAAGGFGLVLLALRGELVDYARRWGRTLLLTLTSRRISYESPASGSVAASGIPFAVVLSLGLALQWTGGPPW
jgi:prepilin peptidase CpaA